MVWNSLPSVVTRRARAIALIAALLLASGVDAARAAPVTIVAVGTSNIYGKGVARSETFPVRLQALLKARGIDARVINAGRNGDTSAGMLARLNAAVPNGTRLVILETYPRNEARQGVSGQTSANLAAMKSQLQARGINSIDISDTMAGFIRSGTSMRLPDGHLNAAGYESMASSLVSQVASAIGR